MYFLNGLEKFKKWGPPTITDNPYSCEENFLAKMLNSAEGEAVYEDLGDLESAEEYIEDLIEMEHATPDSLHLQAKISTAEDSVNLLVCECSRFCVCLNSQDSDPTSSTPGVAMFTDID